MRAPLSLILLCLASLYPISAWETDRVNVTCGSTIKLRNRSSLRYGPSPRPNRFATAHSLPRRAHYSDAHPAGIFIPLT